MKTVYIKIIAVLSLIVLTGCSGKLYTNQNLSEACIKDENKKCMDKYEGVFVYPWKSVLTTYKHDKVLDNKGNVIMFAGGPDGKACLPVDMQETVTYPDYDSKYLIQYDSAFLKVLTLLSN
ncbi:hypothetical protein [Aliamphritea spongicola]|nr:hypothetical protein [Aliamphritea spongicola]